MDDRARPCLDTPCGGDIVGDQLVADLHKAHARKVACVNAAHGLGALRLYDRVTGIILFVADHHVGPKDHLAFGEAHALAEPHVG